MTYYKKKKLKTVLVGWSKWNIGKSEREGSLDFLFGGVGWGRGHYRWYGPLRYRNVVFNLMGHPIRLVL